MAVMGEASTFGGTFRGTDQAGLIVAIALHAALVGVLALQISFRTEPEFVGSESMSVNLATEVSLEATAPDAVAVARAESAPVLGETPPDVENFEEADPTEPSTPTQPTSTPTSRPTTRNSPSPRNTPTSRPTKSNSGSNDFDNAFNRGDGTTPDSRNTGTPAARRGPTELASLDAAVGRQVRTKWQGRVPQGPDAEKLVTRVTFKLNPNGSLAGNPRILGTTGVTDLNRNQVGRHQEEAVRAIRLVGRFRIPFEVPDYNNTFTLRFDR